MVAGWWERPQVDRVVAAARDCFASGRLSPNANVWLDREAGCGCLIGAAVMDALQDAKAGAKTCLDAVVASYGVSQMEAEDLEAGFCRRPCAARTKAYTAGLSLRDELDQPGSEP